MKKKVLAITMAALMAASLTACGGGAKETTAAATTAEEKAEDTTAAESKDETSAEAAETEAAKEAAGEKAHRVEDGHRRFQAQQRRAHRHGEDVPCESRDGLDRVCEKERGQEKRFFHICYNPYLCDQPTSVARGAHHKTTHTPEDGIAWRDSPSPSQETRRSTWNSPMRYPRRRAPSCPKRRRFRVLTAAR